MKIFDGVHKFSMEQEGIGPKRVIVFNSDGRDLPASDVSFNKEEQRLEIKDGTILVSMGGLWGNGANNIATARILANTLQYYTPRNQVKLIMIWPNQGSLQERFATELKNYFIKRVILNNSLNPSNLEGRTFTEYLTEIILLQGAIDIKLNFEKAGKVNTLKTKVLKTSFDLTKLKFLLSKKTLNEHELQDLSKKLQQLRQAITNAVEVETSLASSSTNSKSARLRALIWGLIVNCKVEDVGFPDQSEDEHGNSDSLIFLYLRWMLNNNLLENRRLDILSELALGLERRDRLRLRKDLRKKLAVDEKDLDDVSLAEAMESIICDSTLPDGAFRKNIQLSVAALRVGDTLFIYGGLDPNSLIVSGVNYADGRIDDWIQAINVKFKHNLKIQYSGDMRFEEKMVRDATGSTSQVLNPGSMSETVLAFLDKNDIKHVVSSKTLPSGFCLGGIRFDQIDVPVMVDTGFNKAPGLNGYDLFAEGATNELITAASVNNVDASLSSSAPRIKVPGLNDF